MNYIWETVLAAEEKGIPESLLRFVPARSPSPYLEVTFAELNTAELERQPEEEPLEIEVNPLYRFASVFEELFGPDNGEYEKLREIFLDVFLHYMAQADLLSGLHKEKYYFWFLLEELQNGAFGSRAAEAMRLFDKKERSLIVASLLGLYRSGHCREIFRQLIRALYENALIYEGRDRAAAIYLYVGKKETEQERRRVGFLVDTFLPFNQEVRIFYDKHFGILDVEETMELDRLLLI